MVAHQSLVEESAYKSYVYPYRPPKLEYVTLKVGIVVVGRVQIVVTVGQAFVVEALCVILVLRNAPYTLLIDELDS